MDIDTPSHYRLDKLLKIKTIAASIIFVASCFSVTPYLKAESISSVLEIAQLHNYSQKSPLELLSDPPPLLLKQVEVIGSTVFSPEEFAPITSPYIGKIATFEIIEKIARQITELYLKNGYFTSGAYPPPQDLSDGVLKIQIIEGQLEAIEIKGLTRIQKSYVRNRLMKGNESVLNLNRLGESLQLLQLNPLLERVKAELNQGTAPELSILVVEVKEAPAVSVGLQVDNYESPSIGEYRGTVAIAHQNFLGWGDNLSAEYGITEGLDKFDVSYGIPLNARDGTLRIRYQNGESAIVEEFLSEIGIRASSETLSIGFRQPLVKSPEEEFALSVSLDLRESQTFLLDDIPFSFTLGPDNGRSRVTALRFTQEWVNRAPRRVWAVRSQFSFGLDLFDATVNELGIDGRFMAWQGQFQWVEKWDENVLFLARLATQLTPDSLLPIEQFDLGGIDTVRGYPKNFRVGDNGLVGSVEMRFTLLNEREFGLVELSPFIDVGTVWNNRTKVISPNTLASTGLDLRWQINNFNVRSSYGIPLVDVKQARDSLQGSGFSFSVQWQQRF